MKAANGQVKVVFMLAIHSDMCRSTFCPLFSVLFIFYTLSMFYMFLKTCVLLCILHYLNVGRLLESCRMNQVALESAAGE